MACIQETWLTPSATTPNFPGFAAVRRDRPPGQAGRGGGLLTLVHESVAFTPVDTAALTPPDSLLEVQGIQVELNGALLCVLNVYAPPGSWTPDHASLLDHPDSDSLILGDFNAHHAAWDSRAQEDARG